MLIWWGKRKLQSPSLSHEPWSTLCKVCCSERQPVFCSTVITVLSSQSFYGFLYHVYFTSLSSCQMKNTKINTKRSKLLRRKALEGNRPQSIKGILLWPLLVNPCNFFIVQPRDTKVSEQKRHQGQSILYASTWTQMPLFKQTWFHMLCLLLMYQTKRMCCIFSVAVAGISVFYSKFSVYIAE